LPCLGAHLRTGCTQKGIMTIATEGYTCPKQSIWEIASAPYAYTVPLGGGDPLVKSNSPLHHTIKGLVRGANQQICTITAQRNRVPELFAGDKGWVIDGSQHGVGKICATLEDHHQPFALPVGRAGHDNGAICIDVHPSTFKIIWVRHTTRKVSNQSPACGSFEIDIRHPCGWNAPDCCIRCTDCNPLSVSANLHSSPKEVRRCRSRRC
jgi:hypothetical protein